MPHIPQKRGGGEHRAHTPEPPLEEFFSNYSLRFDYNPTKSASHKFYRLCDELSWERENSERGRPSALQ
jgi:hypothetical protein